MKKEVLRMEHIMVRYAGRNVLEDFHLNIYAGEFLFVYGFPDSGIRELGDMLKGIKTANKGRFYLEGQEIPSSAFETPGKYGIYLVQNSNNLVEDFTVAENLFFGGKKRFFNLIVPKKKLEMMASRLLEQFGLNEFIDPARKAGTLPLFDQIILKLVMAYARGAKLVVIDSIMGVDVERQDNTLIESVLKMLLDDGIAILWLNQRMSDAREMADRVIVMQNGRNVRTIYKGYERILDHLVYDVANKEERDMDQVPWMQATNRSTDIILEMDHIDTPLLQDISMQISAGEIVSVCSMKTRLLENWRNIVTGIDNDYQGSMVLEGMKYHPGSYEEGMDKGVCFLDMMWYERQCHPDMSIEDNLLLPLYWHRNRMAGIMNNGYREYIRNIYRMNYPDWPKDYWWKLSSDQQKILLLEKLCLEPHRLVVITEPFFQLHNTMLEEFYRLIRKVRDNNGAVVLMAIVDMDVRPISDRVLYLDWWERNKE